MGDKTEDNADANYNKSGVHDVLSVSMRPQRLDEIIGQDSVVESVKNIFTNGPVPHTFLITGNTGCCKTTLSRIIAIMLHNKKNPFKINEKIPIGSYDIKEINGSDKNGVDDVREIIDNAYYLPMIPSLVKVYIIDEAHQLTTAAQNALLKITEEPPSHVYFIFCTNNAGKIIATLKRRMHIINMTGLDKKSIHHLLLLAKEKIGYTGPIDELEEELINNEIDSPGLILQAADKFFTKTDAKNCMGNQLNPLIDTKKICLMVSKGDFKGCLEMFKLAKKDDIMMLRQCIIGYLKVILLNKCSLKLAEAIKIIGSECYDLPVFLANVCIACERLKVEKITATKTS